MNNFYINYSYIQQNILNKLFLQSLKSYSYFNNFFVNKTKNFYTKRIYIFFNKT